MGAVPIAVPHQYSVSVPLRGKGSLRLWGSSMPYPNAEFMVSVPLRGIGSLRRLVEELTVFDRNVFPSPCGEKVVYDREIAESL